MNSQKLLRLQKSLLTIQYTADFIAKNINNPLVRNTAIDDLYYLLQNFAQLLQEYEGR